MMQGSAPGRPYASASPSFAFCFSLPPLVCCSGVQKTFSWRMDSSYFQHDAICRSRNLWSFGGCHTLLEKRFVFSVCFAGLGHRQSKRTATQYRHLASDNKQTEFGTGHRSLILRFPAPQAFSSFRARALHFSAASFGNSWEWVLRAEDLRKNSEAECLATHASSKILTQSRPQVNKIKTNKGSSLNCHISNRDPDALFQGHVPCQRRLASNV